jgi:hypothetical protein
MDLLATRVAVIEERLRGIDGATTHQFDETMRRLAELNHAHEKQVQDQATYIGREVFEGRMKELRIWQDEVRNTLSELAGRSTGKSSAGALVFQILPLLVSLITLAVLFWKGG